MRKGSLISIILFAPVLPAKPGTNPSQEKHAIIGVQKIETGSISTRNDITITCKIGNGNASDLFLNSGTGVTGNLSVSEMFDDGLHGDKKAGDNIYGAFIPAQSAGTTLRFYIEAVKDDTPKTRTFSPAGAEHDVFVFRFN